MTNRITERISNLVASQLPEFIRNDYPTFISFLEAYYEYLEQDTYAQELLQNARLYSDIDTTVESFIQYFINQYINAIPQDIFTNKKLLVKNISDLYNAKGSKKSYDLLFRLLFNKSVDIFYPSTQILKASDGKWKQRTSFFMEIITGDPTLLIGNTALIKTPSSLFPVVIESIKDAFTTQGIAEKVKEFYFINDKNLSLDVGNEIEYENFKGRIVAIPNKITVVNPGAGFKIGDILPLTSGTGVSAKVKVTRVTSTGGIRNAQFISYGYGYETTFYNFFTSQAGLPEKSAFEFDAPGGAITISESTQGFSETGTIFRPSYSVDYFLQDYEGVVLRNFNTNTSTNSGEIDNLGTISVSVGASTDTTLLIELGGLAKYPGYYETNDGFLSDDIFLQNEQYYQPFTYVLKIDERLKDYKNVVLDLVHPAGAKLLGELTLINDFDLGTDLTVQLRYLINRFQEVLRASDNLTKNISKPLSDDFVTDDTVGKSVSKPTFDNIEELLDAVSKSLTSGQVDTISADISTPVKDFIKTLGDPGGAYALDYFAEDYSIITETVFIEDDLIILFDGIINMDTDYQPLSESGYVVNTNYAVDYTGSSEDYAGDVALIS